MKKFVIALTLLVGLAAYGADTKNVDKTLSLSGNGSVSLETHNGSIHVHTWDKPQIEIHARIEAGGTSADDVRRFQDTTVEIESSGDSVRIKSKYPDWNWSWSWNGGNSPTIHYTITAPATAKWTIHDHNSHMELRDVRASLSIDTHNGSLRVVNQAGPFQLQAHNGDFRVDFAQFKGAEIDLHNGDVDLSMPASSKFDLRSDSHNGRVDSDFAVLTHSSGRRMHQNLDGPVNGGGPALRLSSHNAHIRIHAK